MLKYNLFITVSLVGSFLLPDYLIKLFSKNFLTEFEPLFLFVITIFSIALSMVRRRWVFNIIVVLFLLFEIAQFYHISAMGVPISPIDLNKIGGEVFDFTKGAGNIIFAHAYVLLVLLPFYFLSIYLFHRYYSVRMVSRYAYLIVLAILLVKPIRAIRKDVYLFYPIPTLSTINNAISCVSCYLFKIIWIDDLNTYSKFDWKPYILKSMTINNHENMPDNIVVFLGESVASSHMGIYGYKRNTTPRLSGLLSKGYSLVFNGVSAGVGTEVSHMYFLNSVREAANASEIARKTGNLFMAAKRAGYKTYFISSQRVVISRYDNYIDYVDVVFSRAINNEPFKKSSTTDVDGPLIEIVQGLEIPKGSKNFIVINQRSSHFPYKENYIGRPEFDIYKDNNSNDSDIDEYDNSILYNDFIITSIITEFEKKFGNNQKSLYVITSDHSQLFGDRGLYKHNHLVPECAMVPMIFYSKDKTFLDFISLLNNDKFMTHYECAKTLLKLMGYDLINPNEKDGVFYINGSNLYMDFAFIKFIKRGENISFEERAFISR